jgi:hypothetical protein
MRFLLGLLPFLLVTASAPLGGCETKKIYVNNPPAAGGEEETPDGGGAPASTANEVLVLDLGTIAPGKDVPFEIPESALGFNIQVEGTAADYDSAKPFGIERLTDPKGHFVHDNFTPSGGNASTSVAVFDTIASVSVPQGEGVPTDLAGTWKLRTGQLGVASSKIQLKAKVRIQSSGDGTFHGGKIDLHLHVPETLRIDNGTIKPADAANHAGMKRRVDAFFALTSRLLGIERGEVVWHTETSTYASIDSVEKLLDGFAVSKGTKDGTQALHILFTNKISINDIGTDGINALGVAPGIPGAATTFGRGVSGIIVATTNEVQEDVLTMIHEAGHFFGLNHTTELAGSTDPLTDTPACENIDPQNLGACPDLSNVMFVAGAQTASLEAVTLSASQKRVYRGSPIYKAFSSGTPKTMSLDLSHDPVLQDLGALKRRYRTSDRPLSRIESELSLGFCGLTRIDANGLVGRFGEADTIAQLRAASQDDDLAPFIRGRATSALKSLGAK